MSADETDQDQSEVSEETRRPALQVVRGDATPEEVAALVAVLTAASGGGEPEPPRPPSRWTSRPHGPRGPLHPGPGAWRASAFPR